MTLIVTQNGTIYNISDFKFITVENNQDENSPLKYCIVINRTYIIGYYNTEEQAIKAVTWIANKIGESFNPNIVIVAPTIDAINELIESEKNEVADNDDTTDA